MTNYLEVKSLRDKKLTSFIYDNDELNSFHDDIIKKTVILAIKKVESEFGPPPTHFTFFLMGSAGRFEQSVWSDQDHGIIFEEDIKDAEHYFLTLGKEIAKGLDIVGYPLCEGNVMSSNPRWCGSLQGWKKQISDWLTAADWESLRHFTTFFDSRTFLGDRRLLKQLKLYSFQKLDEEPYLYYRLFENVGFVKKGVGIFGQLLPDQKGINAGTLNIKQTIFFPFVNSVRVLALMEHIYEPATLTRFERLPNHYESVKEYQNDFKKLLYYRLFFQKYSESYETVHLIKVKSLNPKDKQALKDLIKRGNSLFNKTKKLVEIRCCQ